MKNIIKEAEKFARDKHEGQKRFNGNPYADHLMSAAKIVKEYKLSHKGEELVAAAWLHDTLEDTNTGINELREKFGNLITSLVIELTTDEKKKKIMGKAAYLADKLSDKSKMSSWALVIKLADRLDNLRDRDHAKKSFIKKFALETKVIISSLEKKRKLNETQKKLIKAIKEELLIH